MRPVRSRGLFVATVLSTLLAGCPGGGSSPPAGKGPAAGQTAAAGQKPPATPTDVPPRVAHELVGHAGRLFTIAFSPDGKRIASGDRSGDINVWDLATEESRRFKADGTVLTVGFAANGDLLAGGESVETWDAKTGEVKRRHKPWEHVTSIVFASDGASLLSEASRSMDPSLKVWDVATGKPLWLVQIRFAVVATCLSPDARMIAAAHLATVVLWETAGATPKMLQGHAKPVDAVAFGPDGATLATSSSEDGTIRLWDSATGKAIRTIENARPARSVYGKTLAFTPDGTLLASACADKKLRLWNVATGQLAWTLEGYDDLVNQVIFGPDGKTLATADDSGAVRVWSLEAPAPSADAAPVESRTLEGAPDAKIESVSVSPGGDLIASSGPGGTTLREVASGEAVRKLAGARGVFAPDGKKIATVDKNPDKLTPGGYSNCDMIRVWDVASGNLSRTLAPDDRVACLAFAPDGKTLVVANGNNTIMLWDMAGGAPGSVLDGVKPVRSIAVSPDGKSLAAAAMEARLWDLASGTPTFTLNQQSEVMAVAFSPDNKTLATGVWDGTVSLTDVATGKTVRAVAAHGLWVNSLAFSPDGKTLASGGEDRSVKLWDVASGKRVRTFAHHHGVAGVAFLPDGKTLVSASGPDVILRRLER